MKKSLNGSILANKNGTTNRFLPHSFKLISSCIKTVSSNVKSAGASVAGSISGDSSGDGLLKDQVLWACFDRIEVSPALGKRVLLIGYSNGFQVFDVEDASNVCEIVSKRDDPVTFLQIQPFPAKCDGCEGFQKSHPMLLTVASDGKSDGRAQNGSSGLVRDGFMAPHAGNHANSPTTVRFYSFMSQNYVHILRFRSTVYMVRCSPQIVAVGLAAQIYCFDALTLENKFSVLTYPVTQLGGQGLLGVNIGCGPMAVGPRWLAYASNNPLLSDTGRLSPQSLSPSPGVSPSTSPNSGNLVARYAVESSKHLAAGLINLGDIGYKTVSKYCHELLADGSGSQVSPSTSWKVGKVAAHSVDMNAAGMVIVKDFISQAIVSQFRAHTSPIAALCFDPSGTLLVTASTHGNNINIFRIMPSYLQSGSGTANWDWSASHVHLYKLHRGITSAVIQDICFSSYSQWIAIVSSRGTCHVFVLSPFGGETGLQLANPQADGPTLLPVLSVPWWSTSSFSTNMQSYPPPATITLSVVSRIKNGGWLNIVSSAASSAAGKVLVPSGVVAAAFHSSLRQDMHSASVDSCALEHLLVYSPSGHLIQYELLPLTWKEQGEYSLRNGSVSFVQTQEDELRVKVEPVQWWDVCRRADGPEREGFINGMTTGRQETAEVVMDSSSSCGTYSEHKEHLKPLDRSHWYLSNAEVQLRSGRIPIWRNSKIHFYTVDLHGCEELNLSEALIGGEIEIEKIPVCEIDMKHKDLLPIFDHFPGIHPSWGDDRKHIEDRYTASTISSNCSTGELEGSVSSQFKMVLTERSHAGKKTSQALRDYDEKRILATSPRMDIAVDDNGGIRRVSSMLTCPPMNQNSFNGIYSSASPVSSANVSSHLEKTCIVNSPISPESACLLARPGTLQALRSQGVAADGISSLNTYQSDASVNLIDKGQVHEDMLHPIGFGQYFQEGYCKASTNGESHDLSEVVADVDGSNSTCKEKSEDEQSDDMLGGVFAFSKEG